MFGMDLAYKAEIKKFGVDLVKDIGHLARNVQTGDYVIVTHAVLEFAGETLDEPLYAINDGSNSVKFGHTNQYVFVDTNGVN